MKLTPAQQHVARTALYAAAEVYEAYAADCRERDNSRLAQQFDRQARDARVLAVLIENQGDS